MHLPKFKRSELEETRSVLLLERNVLGVDVEFELSVSPKRSALGRDRFSKLDDIVNRPKGSAKKETENKIMTSFRKKYKTLLLQGQGQKQSLCWQIKQL